jgi:Acyl-CoA dehydrogenase, C-terminal domain
MFDNVPVPLENVLGTIGEGHKVAFNILNLGRVKLGTRNISGARLALNNATKYAKERRQFGRAIAEFGLIKQKLAEMSLRCFIGDAMVYRALGDADRALDAVNPADGPAVLKAIEQFAVECSVNKVFTSETLAYVVDEALQVFGGNGYSREFPAERPYRDARITRIYEGTNEINRMIVATRLLKGLEKSEGRSLKSESVQTSDFRLQTSSQFSAEHTLLGQAKRLALILLAEASAAFGSTVKEEQELLGHVSNIVIDVYAIESGLARAEKIAARGGELAPLAVDAVRVFASDAADRMVHAAKQVARALAGRSSGGAAELIAVVAAHPGVDTVAARRRIADAVIRSGRHPF